MKSFFIYFYIKFVIIIDLLKKVDEIINEFQNEILMFVDVKLTEDLTKRIEVRSGDTAENLAI